ncbi:hypothetical protein CN326_04395 [Bacillus sp. AFS018417]|uniref:Group-specific protein n=1 Tax=Bacillus rhizoplanae TaxID=2880966 RepID=A0ABM8YE62_9BACI|nr:MULTISPECIES: hypothetical protein [Bacillus]MCP1125670.1 hypothetical protein [Bacillus sp. 3103sda1]PEZ08919.1 hypothetical protein CN326_04395 [Bacillus sp. AFS018417]CAG9614092.1 hypothetical protein BACCIP111899_03319 [Bacillus rhizoplanae]
MLFFLIALIHFVIPALVGLTLYWYTPKHSIFYAVLSVLLTGMILISFFRLPVLNWIPFITAILYLIFLPKIKK